MEKTSKVLGLTSSKVAKNETKVEVIKPEPEKKVEVKKPEVPKVVMPSEPDLSEEDISALMTQAIEEKKQEKFAKMIERGSAIAAQSQDQAISQLADKTATTDGKNAPGKLAKAVVEQSESEEAGTESAAVPLEQGVKAENIQIEAPIAKPIEKPVVKPKK